MACLLHETWDFHGEGRFSHCKWSVLSRKNKHSLLVCFEMGNIFYGCNFKLGNMEVVFWCYEIGFIFCPKQVLLIRLWRRSRLASMVPTSIPFPASLTIKEKEFCIEEWEVLWCSKLVLIPQTFRICFGVFVLNRVSQHF